jgi:hypothetical protein
MREDIKVNAGRSQTFAVLTQALSHCVLLVVFVIPALAQAEDAAPEHVEHTVRIEAGKIEEPCFALAMVDRLEYSFTSDGPLDFNLHYHEGQGVYFPVEMKAVSTHAGTFISTGSRKYCLMWTNRGEVALELHYRYQLLRNGEVNE